MSEIIVSEQHKKAIELHQKIVSSAELAQQNLFDMCLSLKKMRDGKLYIELGYDDFETYCESEVGMKRSNAYNYISIIEKISPDKIQTFGHVGISKLSLLASLSHSEQTKISENVNIDEISYRKLKEEVEELKKKNNTLENENEQLSFQLSDTKATIKDLENRPTEIAVEKDPKDAETIKKLKKQLKASEDKRSQVLTQQQSEYEHKLREERAKSEVLRKELEVEKNKSPVPPILAESDSKEVFKVYYKNAISSFGIMLEFIEALSGDKEFYIDKAQQLVKTFSEKLEECNR